MRSERRLSGERATEDQTWSAASASSASLHGTIVLFLRRPAHVRESLAAVSWSTQAATSWSGWWPARGKPPGATARMDSQGGWDFGSRVRSNKSHILGKAQTLQFRRQQQMSLPQFPFPESKACRCASGNLRHRARRGFENKTTCRRAAASLRLCLHDTETDDLAACGPRLLIRSVP